MDLRLPASLIDWIDTVRGDLSREAFIVHHMVSIMNQTKMKSKETPN